MVDANGLGHGGGCVEGRSGTEDVRHFRQSDGRLHRLHNINGGGCWSRILGGLATRMTGTLWRFFQ